MRNAVLSLFVLTSCTAASAAQTPDADHADHAVPAVPEKPRLFQSDMSLMAGMTAEDPMAGLAMPRWTFMDTGVFRLGYNRQGGPSGDDALESTNWNMAMAQRDVGGGRLTLMLMNSLESATLPDGGSPHLFQTGESLRGRPIVDRQHPHDFFMNLSATWRRGVGEHGAWWVQAAPVGEPALGPTAFMHRASAGENPSSPLGHHWEDSTHIATSVITLGGGWRGLTVEASTFHGQEPDERRWNLDGGAPDSFSGRVKLRLPGRWSAQASYGLLKEPEALAPGDTHRTTASLHYGAAGDGPRAATLLWGRNREEHGTSDALLAEGAWQWRRHDQVYARAERAEKPRELLLTKSLPDHEHEGEDPLAVVYSLTVGYVRDFDLRPAWGLKGGLGADLSVFGVPEELKAAYGDSPVGLHAFLRLRWGKPHGAGHAGHTMGH
jgi:hypothetical protein